MAIPNGRAGARVSKTNDFREFKEYWANGSSMSVFLENLEPSTTYYAKGLYDTGTEIAVQADYATFETEAHYFYFENKNDYDITLTVSNGLNFTPDLEYLQNGIWTALGFEGGDESINIPTGTKVYFRGDNPTMSQSRTGLTNEKLAFACADDIYSGGNIMTLLDRSGKQDYMTYPAFCGMFYGFTHLKSAPELPATTLSEKCYQYMFSDCTSLAKGPALPATTLANSCYSSMFYGCTSLKTAPNLPATTLEEKCYSNMFGSCENLTKAPALPATTLADNCYSQMFLDCTSLVTPPALPATTLTRSCYSCMFEGCTSIQTTPQLPATTLAPTCYSQMFRGCTNLVNAEDFPNATLDESCCASMFWGCTSLETAPAVPVTGLRKKCYEGMFADCTALTTAPELSGVDLGQDCYRLLFADCTSLDKVVIFDGTSFDANGDGSYSHDSWMANVAATGTLYVPADMVASVPINSTSGAPNEWNVYEL